MRIHHRLGALVATLTLFVAPAAFACGGYGQPAQVVYAPAPAPVVYAPAPTQVVYTQAPTQVVYTQAPTQVVYQTAGYNTYHHNKKWLHAARMRMNAPVVATRPVVVVQGHNGHNGHNGKHGHHGKYGHQGHHGKQFAHAGNW